MTLTAGSVPAHPAPRADLHYYPILKTLRGELQALRHASPAAWRRMTPFIEVATKLGEASDISPQSPLSRLGKSLADAIGPDRLFFLDFHSNLGVRVIGRLLDQCAAYGLSFIPVVSYQQLPRAELLRKKIGFERGVCFRLPLRDRLHRTGQSSSEQLESMLEGTVFAPERADLVLDLGFIGQEPGFGPEHISRAVGEIDNLPAWRSAALAGTVIPQTLSSVVDQDQVGELDRHEWSYWRRLRQLPLTRLLGFSDYAVQSPERPDGGRGAMGNIRYTGTSEVVIARGHKITANDHAQYGDLARKIQSHRSFRGASFSWGDREIATYADGAAPPLGAEAWRAFGTSHHIELVTDALAAMEAAA